MGADTLPASPEADGEFRSALNVADLLGERTPNDLSGLPESTLTDTSPDRSDHAPSAEDFADLPPIQSWGDAVRESDALNAKYTDSDGRHLPMTPEDARRHMQLIVYRGDYNSAYHETADRLHDELDDAREAFLQARVKGHTNEEKEATQKAYKAKLFELIGSDIKYQTGETARPELSTVIGTLITEAQKREERITEMRAGTVGGKFRKFFRNHPGILMGTAVAAFGGSLLTAKTGILPEVATDTANYIATFMVGVAGYASTRDSMAAVLARRVQKQDSEITATREEAFYGDESAVSRYIDQRQVSSLPDLQKQTASDDPDQNRKTVKWLEKARDLHYDKDDADEAQMLRANSEDLLSNNGLVELLKSQPESAQTYEVLARLIERQVDEAGKKIDQSRRHTRISKLVGATAGVATLGMTSLFGYQRIDAPSTTSND